MHRWMNTGREGWMDGMERINRMDGMNAETDGWMDGMTRNAK